MKKIDKLRVTLLGFLVCLMSMSLMAQRVTMDFTTNEWGLPVGSSAGITASTPYTNADGYTITLAASTKFYFHNEGYLMLGKSGSTLTLPAFDFNVEKIEIVGTSGASGSVKQNIYVGDAAVSTETTGAKNVTNVYQIADAYQAAGNVYTIKVTSAHNTQITYIKVYEAASPAAVAAPTFNPVGGSYFTAQNLTISTATSGAAIYYTLDSSDPKTNGILYGDNQVIPINQTTVVKAIAVLGEDTSNVTTATYTLNIPVELATIEAFKAAEHDNNTIYKITGDVKVLGQYDNKKYTFIQDMGQGTYAALCIYDNNGSNINTYNPGDVISDGVYGKYKNYNGLVELVPVEGLPFAEGTPGEVIAPDVRTLDNVLAYYDWFEGKLVTIKGLTFTESQTFGTNTATKGAIATQGENTIKVYNTLGTITGVEVSEGMTADVTGYIIRYGEDIEIAPRGSEDIVEVVGPAVAPWTATFEDATENSAWEIENGNANKWFIGQAQGFDNNKLYISSNNGVTNKYIAEYSFVKASRAIVIPQNGAVLSFDYRVNGNNNDYMQVSVVKGGESTTLERLSGANEWTNATYTISPDMAGEATLEFLWTNSNNTAVQFPAAIDNVSLVASSCSQPTALQDTVEGTTATISWTGDAEAYLLQYKLADHSEWYSVNTTENTVVLNNLQGNSNYNVRVQSVCGDDASAWVEGNFVVKCQNLEEITSTEDVVIGNGTSTQRYLFNGYYGFGYSANLYTMTKAGTIHSIAFYQSSPESSTGASLDLWVKAVPADYALALSNTFNSMLEGAQQICSGISDFSTSGWKVFNIEGGFTLEEGQNLLVLSKAKGCTTGGGCTKYVRYTSSSNKVWYKEADNNDPGQNVSGSLSSYLPNITINMDVTTIVCGDVEACPAVTNVQVDNITPNSAELTWNRGNESETNFKVEYYAEGSTDVVSVLVEDTAYTLSDLAQLTNYTVKVQALCGENNTSEPVEIEFATPGICPPVSDIQSSNAANTTTLTWTPGGEETAWLVQFKPADAGDNEWISINVNSLPTTTFGGLMATTDYDVRVKALCDPAVEENQSEWANHEFTSGCAAATVPYSIAFGTDDASCWENNGFNASYVSTHQGDEMISQALIIPTEGDYYVAFNVNGNYEIYASDRGTRADRFTLLESGSKNGVAAVLIPDNYKGKTVYFKLANGANQNLTLRKMEITTCPFVPSALTTSNITSNSIDLAWTADERATDFQVKVVDVATDAETIVDVTGNSTTIDNLVYGNTYKFYVRANCGNSESEWFGPVSKKIEISYIMGEQATATTCAGTLYDNGGANGDYSNSSNDVMVINPASDNSLIRLQGDYNTESGWDYIYVYDGVGTEGTELYKVSGVGTLDVTSALGALTIKFTSDGSSTKSGFAFAISCEPAPACANPIDLAFNGTTSTLSWNPGIWGTPTAYNVRYGIDGENTYQETTTTTNSIQLSGLLSNTSYVFGVQSVCGENETSEWTEINVVTPCMALDLPYSENFDSYEVTITSSTAPTGYPNQIMPDCWSFINMSTSTSTYPQMFLTAYSSYRVTGNCFFFKSSSSDPAYVILPQFTTPIENIMVSFAYRNEGTSASNGTLYLGYMSNPNDANSFVPVYTCDRVTTMTNVQQPFANAGVSGTNYYLAFRYTGGSNNNYYASIDNIVVEAIPTCGTPSISVSGTLATITPSTVAGTPESYDLQIGDVIQTVQATETETSVDLDSYFTLAPQTTYSVSVRANCGDEDGQSLWSDPVSFTTPCGALPVPYTEDFEDYSSGLPGCWTKIGVGTVAVQTSSVYAGSKSLKFSNSTSNVVVLPAFEGENLQIRFYTKPEGAYSSCGQFDVGYVNANNEFTALTTYSYNDFTAYEERIVNMSSMPANAKMAFRHRPTSTSYYWFVDNVIVENIPTCGVPTIAVYGTTATITPKAPGTPESYELKIGEETRTVPETETETTVDLDSIFNLELNTTYEVSVRANCGEGDQSEWSQPVSFTTPECFGSRTVAIGNGTVTHNSFPTYAFYNYSLSEQIFDASEIGEAGDINKIKFYATSNPVIRNLDVYMIHTTKDAFANGSDYIPVSSTDKVFSGNVYIGANQWTTINLDTRFAYNGSDNIALVFVDKTGGYASSYPSYKVHNVPNGQIKTWYAYTDNSAYNPTTSSQSGNVVAQRNNIQFDLCPAPVVTCPRPSNLVVDEVTESTANLTWTEGDVETQWEVEYGVEGFVHGEGTSVIVNENTLNLVGLASATTYNVYVRAICAEGDSSLWLSTTPFTTSCAAYTLPYTENFDSYTSSTTVSSSTMPICWSRLFTGTSTSYGVGIYPSTSYSRSGANSLRFYNYGSGTSASYGDAYAILPEMAADINILGMELYATGEEDWYGDMYSSEFEVGVVTDVNDPVNSFVSVQTIVPTSTSYEKFEVSFAEYTGANGHIAFRMLKPNSSYAYAYIDDITVEQVVFEKDLAINSIDPIAWACDQSDAKVTINVENAGFADTITSFVARYVVNTQEPVSETVSCNLAPGETMSYTFNTTPVFVDGENTVHAIVDMEGDMQVENNYTDPIIVSLLEPETVPYTPTLSADLVNKGWNVVDANSDGITMDIKNGAIVYSFNDTLAANDWMFTPCIEMAAGSYNVYFDYKANSSLTETFEVYYGQGANVDAMTNNIAYLDFNNTDYETAMLTITVAEDGIYNFGFNAMSLAGNLGFSITKFEVYPVVNVTVISGANGTVTPNGVVPVNYGEDLSLSIVPNTMYHVAGITVDGELVQGEDATNANFMLYTLSNVTESHNVYVDFKLEFHVIKSVENYNPAYTDVCGWFVPAATDTTNDADPRTLSIVAAPHYFLYSLEEGLMTTENMTDVTAQVVDLGMNGENHEYSFTTDSLRVANYYYKATFRRDTVNIHYIVETGKGYIDASDLLEQGANYDTWVDYSVAQDVNHTSVFVPYTTGDAHTDYHVVNVTLNDSILGAVENYTIEDITATQNVAVQFGYEINATIRNYVATYLDDATVRGTIEPATQLVAEGDATVVTGTIEEHFHLYNIFVDGVDMINDVVFGADGSYTLTLANTNANYNIEAVVKIDTFAINYNVLAGRGYADQSDLLIAPATYSTIVNYGDDFLTNLVPAEGFRIENVVVDGVNMYTAPNYQYNFITESHNIDVTFTPNTYTVTVNAYGQGTVSDNLTFVYDPENPMNYDFFATPAEGYHIEAMYLNGEVMEDMPEFAREGFTAVIEDVHENMTFDVHFAINTYTVDVTANAGGTTNIQGTVSYNYGENVTVIATADEGHYISSISIDGEVTEYTQDDNRTTYSIDFEAIHENHVVIVDFGVQKFNITATVDADANHGTINYASSFEANLSYGNSITLNFIPEANYQVSDVVVDGQSVGAVASYEFVNINADHNVVVSFAPVQYTLTATSNVPACTITPATTTVQAGSNVNYTLTVATGYHLLNVIANGEEVSVSGNAFTIANVQEDYEIFANFAPNNVTVTVAQPAHATITPGTMTYAYGATPSYVIVPEAGYNVTAVHAGNALVNVTYNNGIGSFTLNPVTADITLTATTAIKTFTITATQAAHGTISPAPVQTVNYGGNVTYTITPDQFYAISDVKVDGASRGAISSYTFNNVTGNHTIEAVFEAACYEPTNLTAMDITTTSAVLSWVGTAPSYEVRYRKAADANWNTQTVTVPTVTLTGLDSNTLYAWEVRAYCTAQLQSEWVANSFMTKAGAQPYDPTSIASAEFNTVKVYSHLNNVYVVNENGVAISSIAIFDINGKQVYTGSVNGSTEVISLNVANGSYIVRLASENGVGIYKVSIVR